MYTLYDEIRRIPKGELIFEVNSKGVEFFIILQGNCGVFTRAKGDNDSKDVEAQLVFEPTIKVESGVTRLKSSYSGVPPSYKARDSIIEYREEFGFSIFYRKRMMVKVANLTKGQTFGGMSLSEKIKNGRRGASILAQEDTYCAALDRDSYLVRIFQEF